MTCYLVECYTPNARWLALSRDEREAFLRQVQQGMTALAENPMEILTLACNASDIDHGRVHHFLGIWRFGNEQARDALLQGIAASGWYDYFEHENFAAAESGFGEYIQDLINI